MSERMSDEEFEEAASITGFIMAPAPSRVVAEARRARESDAQKARLLVRLLARLDHATCAGVESWPEYAELKQTAGAALPQEGVGSLDAGRAAAIQRAENIAASERNALRRLDLALKERDAAVQRAEKAEADLKWLRESVIRAPFRSQRDAALEQVRVLREAMDRIVQEAQDWFNRWDPEQIMKKAKPENFGKTPEERRDRLREFEVKAVAAWHILREQKVIRDAALAATANLSLPSTVKGDDKPGQTREGEKP